MSLRQVEALYKKLHASARERKRMQLDPEGRSEIFDRIMADVERLLKKIKKLPPGSEDFDRADSEIRLLLMKEIQVIIDDYVLCRQSGTLKKWADMYGDIRHYIRDYYAYRDGGGVHQTGHRYGFYDEDLTL
jgi:hypothetical protein